MTSSNDELPVILVISIELFALGLSHVVSKGWSDCASVNTSEVMFGVVLMLFTSWEEPRKFRNARDYCAIVPSLSQNVGVLSLSQHASLDEADLHSDCVTATRCGCGLDQ